MHRFVSNRVARRFFIKFEIKFTRRGKQEYSGVYVCTCARACMEKKEASEWAGEPVSELIQSRSEILRVSGKR